MTHKKIEKVLSTSIYCVFFIVISIAITIDTKVPFNYINIAFAAIFCLLVVAYILFFGSFKYDYFVALLFVFLLSQVVSTIVNLFVYFSRTGILMVLLSFFSYEFFKQKNHKIKNLIYLFALAGLVLILLFFFKYYREIFRPNFSNRIGTFFGNQNDVARHFSFISLIFIACIFETKHKYLRFLFIVPACIAFYLLLLTGSLSNFVVIFIVIAIALFFLFGKKYKIIYFCILISIITLFIILINIPALSYYRNRIINVFNSFFGSVNSARYDNSAILRFRGAIYGFELFFHNPFFGNGYSSVYRNYYIMSHNNIAEICADFGIVGILSYESILAISLVKNKNKRFCIILILLYIIIFQLFLVCFNDKITSILVAFCASNARFEKKTIVAGATFANVNI